MKNEKSPAKILGLDLGTSSIGWWLLEGHKTLGAGVRIFPEGMDRTRGEKSLNQDRRDARAIRRQTYRRVRRKSKLKHILQDFELLPPDQGKLDVLFQTTKPYELRARALNEALEPWQLGRALYHLGQRRGYLSNRKTGNEKDGKVAEGISEISQAMSEGGFRTLGEYFAGEDSHSKRIRSRYTSRAMYEKEFNLIWDFQAKHHPELLDEAQKQAVYEAIFHQRPLKIQKHLVGKCDFEPDRKRGAKATLVAQEFRLWSNINNLKILLGDGTERWLTDKERATLHDALKDKKQLSWEKTKTLLGFYEADRFNLEKVRKSGMLGNQTTALIKPAIGAKNWKGLGDRGQEQLISDLLYINDDRSLKKRLQRKWHFNEDVTEKLIKRSGELPKGYMHLSQKAMRNIVKELRRMKTPEDRGPTYDKACEAIGYVHTKPREKRELERLPFPGKTSSKHQTQVPSVVTTEGLRNPLVERALFQVRKVVNAIIRDYGKPDIIRVELARDLKSNAKQRNTYQKQQRANEQANEEAEKFLKEDVEITNPTRTDKLKYRLWQECKQVCPFSGKSISPHELFIEPIFEIEHIIPYSRSLDDSYMNKTLCHREWNTKKSNQTPNEAFHSNEEEYASILQRAKILPYPKFKRFAADAIKDMDDFVTQQLNETRYIARKTVEYLQQLGIRVEPVKGGTTAILRRAWGLNNILADDGEKTRLDHRHHAIDALVVALTTRSAVQKINTHSHLSADGRIKIQDYKSPIPDLRQKAETHIENMVVSHKSQRKIKGPLHKEFLYSLTGEYDEKGIPIVAIRKSLSDMKEPDLKHIRDAKIRELAFEHLSNAKNYNDAFKNPDNPFQMKTKNGGVRNIRKVRLVYNRSVTEIGQPLSRKNNKKRNVWTMGNHHVELLEYENEKSQKKWKGKVVSTLEATLRNGRKEPVVETRSDPAERFVGVLHPNDMVRLEHKGQEKICRVQKMDINENIVFREHTDADIKDWKKQINFTANTLKGAQVSILEVDPIGQIRSEKPLQ